MNSESEIIKLLLESDSKHIDEMANVSKQDTGLPYSVWIDSEGKDRVAPHNVPRLKVDVDGDRIPVSISDTPKILVNKNIPQFSKISSWIIKYKNVLLQHWNKELTDRQTLNMLGK